MTAHDDVVQGILLALPPGAELRLLGRVDDPSLGNSSAREVFFFVPDLHLISPERRAFFGNYGFNHEEDGLLARILERMLQLGQHWEATGTHKLITVQLGDFFDLWREFGGVADVTKIADVTHGELRDLLYRNLPRGRPCLKATMIIGNHDTKRGVPLGEIGFHLKAFDRGEQPFLFVTHGDVFDILEKLVGDAIQEFVVHFLGSLTPVNKYAVGPWGRETGRLLNEPLGKLRDFIMAAEHPVDCQGAPKVTQGAPLPKTLARTVVHPGAEARKRFRNYWASFRAAANRFVSAEGLRVVVVGHSHEAGMLFSPAANGQPAMLLMDVGAWIEKCTYPLAEGGDVEGEPNAQLGVLHGNDARIYQVHFPAFEV